MKKNSGSQKFLTKMFFSLGLFLVGTMAFSSQSHATSNRSQSEIASARQRVVAPAPLIHQLRNPVNERVLRRAIQPNRVQPGSRHLPRLQPR